MNKADLIRELADRTKLSRSEAAKVVDAVFASEGGLIADALSSGKKVQITGFGTFEARRRAARKGRNPQTGKEIEVAPSSVASFRVGKRLKDSLGRAGRKSGTRKGTGSTGPRRIG